MGLYKMGCHKKKCVENFEAILNGKQEVPVNESNGFGRVNVVLVDNKLKLSGYFQCLETEYDEAVGSHIHLGYAGATGAVVFELTPELDCDKLGGCYSECENTFELTAEQVSDLKDRRFYVNIHTTGSPAGELRGQILPDSHRYFIANLSGDNEVPPVVTTAFGTLVFELNKHNLTVSGSFDNLSSVLFPINGSAAHIHFGPALTNGPVVFALQVEADVDNLGGVVPAERNVFSLTCDQIKLLKDKDYYVNIHTVNNEDGELRAQICKLKYVKATH